MKQIFFDGRIGREGAEVRTTQTGKKYIRFSVANNSFVRGNEKTEWFDVTCFDQTIVEKRAQYLTRGSYVIINGTLNTEVNVDKQGKVWVNQYVTATTIEMPMFGKKDSEGNVAAGASTAPTVSTYTGGTMSTGVLKPNAGAATPAPQTAPVTPKLKTAAESVITTMGDDDDLPF